MNFSYKPAFFLFFVSVLVACATAPQSQTSAQSAPDPATREYTKEFMDDFARTKLSQNGPHLFCDQPGYLQCYHISQAQCLQELSGVTDDCFHRTSAKFPHKLTTAREIDQFASYYAVCMSFRHVGMHADRDMKQLGACLKKVKWDRAQRDRSLLR